MTWTTRPRSEGAGALTYFREGTGATLVLIHGVGLRAEAWAGMMPELAAHFDVYAVDMPGHGGSALGDVGTLESYVARLQTFVETLPGPAFVAGHSMGAILAMKLAARMGAKVAGIAALNAIYQRDAAAERAVRARAAAITAGGEVSNTATLARWFGDAPTGAMKAAAAACDGWLSGVDQQGYGRAYTAFAHQDGPTEAELRAFQMPALFMTGAQDLNSTPAMSQAMAALAPQGRADVIKDAAHMMPMTHSGTVTEAMIATFQPKGESHA